MGLSDAATTSVAATVFRPAGGDQLALASPSTTFGSLDSAQQRMQSIFKSQMNALHNDVTDAHHRGQEEELLMLRLALGKFSGHPRSTRIEIEDFIGKHNRYLKLTDENDRRAQAHVALYLIETAAVWFRNLCKDRQPHDVAFPRKEIFAAMRDRFCPKNDEAMIRDLCSGFRDE
ncbi:hypothetical protein HDU89_005668 [Geranomyces variabilis]|nr:hypothetical protein HDU89_005668 [Geranomyces variabilis]